MRPHRGTIFVEEGAVLQHVRCEAQQHILRIAAPLTARHATPGSFVHLRCGTALPMRRPLSIMRAAPEPGWIEVLFKVVGAGTAALGQCRVGEPLNLLGPIGQGFTLRPERPRVLAIGGGVGIPPMIFLAEALRSDTRSAWKPLVLMGSEIPFPFQARPSRILVPAAPAAAIACMPLLDEWGIPSRLASNAGFAGCFEGHVTELASEWLAALTAKERDEVALYACGPPPMLAAAARLARANALPCQVALEEFMACAVGGCAGCAVEVRTSAGTAMKRVCVDGPVFEAETVFP
ncbi:MAG TPA: dihydroorotate dehydrogenase electron transfer subunit [Steroidobacteraceae bacterium]|nr:dihydroorotate dehydrogenase electron transfer subunit [Steroidobacteraceae bacterium]